MKKTISIDVTKTKYRSPGKIISRFDEKLTQTKGIDSQEDPTEMLLSGNPSESGVEQTSVAEEIVEYDNTMTVDSVKSGQTVEEQLTRQGNFFITSFPVDFFRNVWFDGLEAYMVEHWILSGSNHLIPMEVLSVDTEVIGRYTVV